MTIDSPGMSSQRGLPEPDKEPQAKEVLKDSGNLPNAAIKSVKAGTPINLDSAVQDAKAMQDFEPESFLMGAEHSQKVKAAPIKSDYGSRDCVDLASSTAESRINTPKRLSPQDRTVGVSNLRALLPKKNQENDNIYISIKTLLQFLKGNVTEEGIFRISGNQTEVTRLLKELKSNPKADIKKADIHDATSCLKRSVGQCQFDKAIGKGLAAIGSGDTITPDVLERAKELPWTANQKMILDDIMSYVVEVAKNSSVNQMSPRNLAIVIAPWFEVDTFEATANIQNFFQSVIENNVDQTKKPFKFAE